MEKISKAQVKMVRSLQQKKYRDELGLFVAEGEKCVSELSKAFELVHLYREGENASRTEIEQMSVLKTPQGVIAVFEKKPIEDLRLKVEDLVVALDGIQDPGNLGTIIRTCDWFGVHDILCSQDTADCYNPKVVQATMGALARVHLHYVNLPQKLSEIRNQNLDLKIYGTLLEGRNMYEVLKERPLTDNRSPLTVIIMGNEGNGISQEVRQLITHPILIPSYPPEAETSESLNVSIATAIVLAEFRRGC
ncbi:MAG: RNA methyltransferase [Paludibacteraceae bacterium]|nr:RNA methyltransferase [Paludibacteraceae bacterium]